MDRSSLIFCVGSLVAFVAVAWIGFPLAALEKEVVTHTLSPQPPELMPMVDVGQGFGELPVAELMFYYVENPPAPVAVGAAPAPEIKFGGC